MVQILAAGSVHAATCAAIRGHAYARREPEKTALYQVFHRHLPRFERMWADSDSENCLPGHVTQELHLAQVDHSESAGETQGIR